MRSRNLEKSQLKFIDFRILKAIVENSKNFSYDEEDVHQCETGMFYR